MTQPPPIEAVVLGRVGVDLYPNQLETPLAEVKTFTRFVGGFAGNVATGLARLGVRTAIVSRIGAEGHGEYVRGWLAAEGIARTDAHIRFYSDHVSDAPVLEWADEPFAVNPSGALRRLAGKRGWPVLDWGI